MKHILSLATILAVGFFQHSSGLSAKDQKLVAANNNFALRLLKIIPSHENDNIVFSPYSISAALGMTYAGARGLTRQEMSQALGYTQAGLTDADVLEAFASQNSRLHAGASGVGLNVANGAAIKEDFEILDTYYAALNRSFNAHLLKLTFANNIQHEVDTINAWVKQATHDKIEKLFEEPLDVETRLVLLNAIVLKGMWASEFKRENTTKRSFWNGGTESTDVDFMFQQLTTNYVFDEILQAKVIELLHHGDEYSMVILLPFGSGGVEALKQNLTSENLGAVISLCRNTTVDLYLPKFELEKQNILKSDLMNLGLRKIFGKADLSGVAGNLDLFVSDVVQRAVVKIDEEGTEAAAASGGTLSGLAAAEHHVVKVNHPFLFFIRNRVTEEIFFAGQVNKL